jgi:hypothetical protein
VPPMALSSQRQGTCGGAAMAGLPAVALRAARGCSLAGLAGVPVARLAAAEDLDFLRDMG